MKWENAPNTLQHYGLKGMRWGVRRSEAQLGKNEAASSSKGSGQSGPPNKRDPFWDTVDMEKYSSMIDDLNWSDGKQKSKGEKLARKYLKPPREEPMYKWSDEEVNKFEGDYSKAKSSLNKAFKSEKDPDTKLTIAVEADNLENFHQSYAEWD